MNPSPQSTESFTPIAYQFLRRRLVDAAMIHLVDGVMLFFAMWIGDCVLFLWNGIPVQLAPILLLIPAWWAGTWVARLVPGWGMGAVEELRRVELLLLALFSAAIIVVFLERGLSVSRITFLVAYLIATVLIPLGRVFSRKMLVAVGMWGVPTVIYGDSKSIPIVANLLLSDRSLGFIPQGAFCEDSPMGDILGGVPVLGGVHQSTRQMPVAVLALPQWSRSDLIDQLEGPLQMYQTVLLVPDLDEAPSLWVRPCDMRGVLALEIRRNLLNPVANFTKSFVECLFVTLTLPIWGPLCLFLMGLVWLHDFKSPVYAQERIGKNNKRFKAYKLRTMVPDAETVLHQKLAENPALKAEWEQHYKLKNDPRITWIGKVLRKTSLDEIPQLWCVLMGTMALVGPRPLPLYHHDELNPRTQRLRIQVRPGITGLWQVSGRSESGTAGMNKWDVYYVTNWSIWLDVVILARTVRVVLLGSGAY